MTIQFNSNFLQIAKNYRVAIEFFYQEPGCLKQLDSRRQLRDIYLGCPRRKEVSEELKTMGADFSWKIEEWNKKIEKGLLTPYNEKNISIETLKEKSLEYIEIYKKAAKEPTFVALRKTHEKFKIAVLKIFKDNEKATSEEIQAFLYNNNVTSKELLAKISYWK